MFDLLIASLRSRPDYIIVGEIRGKEANITFQAMQTGHPVISTFHAGSVHSMIQRLTGDPINIPIAFIDNLNVVLIQSAVYVNGKVERRVLSVTEIINYNDDVGKVLTKEVFLWDNVKDKHMFRGLYNSYILEQKVAKHMGLEDSREIYNVMKRRTRIIERMIENKIFDYFEFVKLLKAIREEGERALPFSI
jgi:flagellar protein FlaI